jgi:hypothetical protein
MRPRERKTASQLPEPGKALTPFGKARQCLAFFVRGNRFSGTGSLCRQDIPVKRAVSLSAEAATEEHFRFLPADHWSVSIFV